VAPVAGGIPMLKKTGLSSLRAFSKASAPHGYQSTGLWACCKRYGDFSWISLFGFSFVLAGIGIASLNIVISIILPQKQEGYQESILLHKSPFCNCYLVLYQLLY
jgi:hypothetical protein